MDVLVEGKARRRASWGRRFLVAFPLLALLALGGGAAGVYAYDRSQTDRLATGVTVGGIDIGGLTTAEARALLTRRLLPRYERSIVVVHGGRGFRLRPAAVGLRVDIGRAVTRAHAASRRGSVLQRVYRYLRARPLQLHLAVRVRYSPAKVRVFAGRVSRAVARKPRAAEFVPSLVAPRILPSRNGVAVRRRLLRATISARLADPSRPRRFALPVRTLVPKPTTTALRRQYRHYLSVSRGERRLRLFNGLKLVKTYLIAVGQAGLETPGGVYRINDKQVNPSWHVPKSPWAGSLAGRIIPPGPSDPIKARWMGFYNGAGIHGTDAIYSLGTAASHGCIRMSIPDVIELFEIVPLGTPIFVA
jgi:lipoprotein-anchoring transpeptidase ErfK/SrfK